jgi:uncharacterized membrane protein YjdF
LGFFFLFYILVGVSAEFLQLPKLSGIMFVINDFLGKSEGEFDHLATDHSGFYVSRKSPVLQQKAQKRPNRLKGRNSFNPHPNKCNAENYSGL